MEENQTPQLQSVAAQLQRLQAYLQMLEEQTQEVARAIGSIDELQAVREGTEAYVPLTNGIMIKATLGRTDSFLINVGNDVITEHTPAQAKKLLQDQQAELEKTQQTLVQQFSTLYQEYFRLQIGNQEE